MSSKDLNFAGEAVFEAINNQIRDNNPPLKPNKLMIGL
jgi:hypothetical protein